MSKLSNFFNKVRYLWELIWDSDKVANRLATPKQIPALTDEVSYENFKNWVLSLTDNSQVFYYIESQKCPLAMFLKQLGHTKVSVGAYDYSSISPDGTVNKEVPIPRLVKEALTNINCGNEEDDYASSYTAARMKRLV